MSDEMEHDLAELDRQLAEKYGCYASYSTDHDPISEEPPGNWPLAEIQHMLDVHAAPGSCVLDLGCGAGFTLCRLAANVQAIWGFEQAEDLLAAALVRVASLELHNATLVAGNLSEDDDVALLPDDAFDLGFSLRGPNLDGRLMPKLKQDAVWIQEFAQLPIGLNDLFGRNGNMFRPHSNGNPDWPVGMYAGLGMRAVCVMGFYWDQYFRDTGHLADYLGTASFLMGRPYDPDQDRDALDLYARYNTTPKGVRMTGQRKLAVYRRG